MNSRLTKRITDLLDSVRQRIRRYIWIEGLAVAIAWFVAIYWIAFALDFLPVRLGANEMPVAARMTLLVFAALAVLFVLYRWILRRAWARLEDRSVALLIERKFPEFQDSLVTAVELDSASSDDPLHDDFLIKARDKADRHAGNIDPEKIFNYWPLRRALLLGGTAVASIAALAILAWPTFQLSLKRLYGLTDATYVRQTYLEMADFEDNQITVARGSDVVIRVLAASDRPQPPPKVCTILYQTTNGERGRINMSRKGAPRDGFQEYTLDSKPFKSILSDVRFDVVGNDYRIRDQLVRVVDSPQVVNVTVRCDRPKYTGLSSSDLAYFPGLKLAQGSRLLLNVETNKPLISATVTNALDSKEEERLTPSGDQKNEFSFPIESLNETVRKEINLKDVDGVVSQKPYVISVVAVPDSPPQVEMRLNGIGSAITPDARLPVMGQITDDYGVDKTWYELELPGDETRQISLNLESDGDIDTALDLREQRAIDQDPLDLQVNTKVILSIRASDKYDLDDAANIGQGDRYELEVVTANQLIALLEAREIGLRKRFVQIIEEMRESRDSLARVQYAPTVDEEESTGVLSDNEGAPTSSMERAIALRQLRVQRALQHTQRSAQEVNGVALSFEDIRQELINNRIDAADRMERIENDIANPLKQIVADLYPVLENRLDRLDDLLANNEPENVAASQAVASVAAADEILLALEGILQKMLELETYNELVDLVRELIRDQDDLSDRTRKEQKKSALELLK